MYITNRFWTTVASLGALFFNCVNLAQDVEQKSWFHLAKLILILAVTYIMKSKNFEQTKRFSNKISTELYHYHIQCSLPVFSAAGVVGASVVVVVGT